MDKHFKISKLLLHTDLHFESTTVVNMSLNKAFLPRLVISMLWEPSFLTSRGILQLLPAWCGTSSSTWTLLLLVAMLTKPDRQSISLEAFFKSSLSVMDGRVVWGGRTFSFEYSFMSCLYWLAALISHVSSDEKTLEAIEYVSCRSQDWPPLEDTAEHWAVEVEGWTWISVADLLLVILLGTFTVSISICFWSQLTYK